MAFRFRWPAPRLRLRTLIVLVAACAVSFWIVAVVFSPTTRLTRRLRANQPTYLRREAAASLGRDIPAWETERAIDVLIAALADPSPRVRESAMVGLYEHGARAARATPKLIALLRDPDRGVRFAAAGTLGLVAPTGPSRAPAVAALTRTCASDPDALVRVWAAGALVKLGASRPAIGALAAAIGGADAFVANQARYAPALRDVRFRPDDLLAELAAAERARDEPRRRGVLLLLMREYDTLPPAGWRALQAARDDPDPEIRREVARLLPRGARPDP